MFRARQGNVGQDAALCGLGGTLDALGKYDEAERVLRQSLKAFEEGSKGCLLYTSQHFGPEHSETASALGFLGIAYCCLLYTSRCV